MSRIQSSRQQQNAGQARAGVRIHPRRQPFWAQVAIASFLLLGTSACVVPAVTQSLDSGIDFKKFKSVSFTIDDQVKTAYSKDTLNLFDGVLRGKLRTFGYNVLDNGGDFSIDIFVDEAKQGDKAAMFFLGFGAGRALLTFTALFKDSGGERIGRFSGGKSFHGQEFGNSALWKSHEEMQLEMVGESVRQIARFIETNGRLE